MNVSYFVNITIHDEQDKMAVYVLFEIKSVHLASLNTWKVVLWINSEINYFCQLVRQAMHPRLKM